MHIFRVIALISAALLAVGACSSTAATANPTAAPAATGAPTAAPTAAATAAAGGPVAVTISNFSFNPAGATVSKGSTVGWSNKDSVGHTVTFDDSSITSSGTLQPGAGAFSVTFSTAGTFAYHCSIHPSMKGIVTVS